MNPANYINTLQHFIQHLSHHIKQTNTHTHTHETNGTQLHAHGQSIQSPEEKWWVLRADLNDAMEEKCRREKKSSSDSKVKGDEGETCGPARRLFLNYHGGCLAQKHFPVWLWHVLVSGKGVPVTQQTHTRIIHLHHCSYEADMPDFYLAFWVQGGKQSCHIFHTSWVSLSIDHHYFITEGERGPHHS